jgi:glutamate---cysteine ligase / carboxylate-amine ligase
MAVVGALPTRAQWGAPGEHPPWTLGVEEEAALLDGRTGSIANCIEEVLTVLPPRIASHFSAETHACVIELRTAPRATAAHATAELVSLRGALDGVVRERLGLQLAAAGTHPCATAAEVRVAAHARYQQIAHAMRSLASREPTMALHVHVGVPDPAAAVRALDGLRGDLPLLLALSANSPYAGGRDSGFASARTLIFSAFPRVGIPRVLGTYANYLRLIDTLVRSGAVPDPSFLWWDVRLQPRLGTVEVRIMDAQTRVADAGALAAVVQCLVRRHVMEESAPRQAEPELLAENRFLAARDGMHAHLLDGAGPPRPARDAVAEMLDACRPVSAELGCSAEIGDAVALAADSGADRQRRLVARDGLASLPASLAADFTAAAHPPARLSAK